MANSGKPEGETAKRIWSRTRALASGGPAQKEERSNKCVSLWRSHLAGKLSVDGVENLKCWWTFGGAECSLHYTSNVFKEGEGLNCIFTDENHERVGAILKEDFGVECDLRVGHQHFSAADGSVTVFVAGSESQGVPEFDEILRKMMGG